jgi:hypothetical protein
MYIQRKAENLIQNAFLGFEIFSFEVDEYMYVQKTFFFRSLPVFITRRGRGEGIHAL